MLSAGLASTAEQVVWLQRSSVPAAPGGLGAMWPAKTDWAERPHTHPWMPSNTPCKTSKRKNIPVFTRAWASPLPSPHRLTAKARGELVGDSGKRQTHTAGWGPEWG